MKLILYCCMHLTVLPALAQKKDRYPLIGIPEVPTTRSDTFRVNASVESLYSCPPCPKGAMCKPCIGNHIIVTQYIKELNGKDSTRLWLRIFTEKPDQFMPKKAYVFTLSLRNKVRHEEAVLIRFEPGKK